MKHLIVLIDALGWLTVERLGFLDDLLPERRALKTVFGYSSTAIPTLLTGAWPQEHGHWFLYRRSRQSPFRGAGLLARLPGRLSNRGRVRNYIQEKWRRDGGVKGYFSLYEVPYALLPYLEPVEQQDTWGTGAFPHTPTLIDHLGASGLSSFVSDWRDTDETKVEKALSAVKRDSPDVVVVYLTEVDGAQHRWGTLHPQFENSVRRSENQVRRLREAMGGDGVSLQVFSDHGMTDIARIEDLQGALKAAGLRNFEDFVGFYDSTVARFWDIRDEGRLRKVLDDLSWGHVLTPQEMEGWRVQFPQREYGDLFFLVDPGVLILPSHMGSQPLAAMHGYTPDDPTSDACFLSSAPLDLGENHITAVLPALLKNLGLGVD